MKIENNFASNQATRYRNQTATPGESFGSMLAKAGQSANGSNQTAAAPKGPAKILTQEEKSAAAQAAHEALWAEFRDYMSKTPAELMRERILEELGLSEEDLAAMPPEKRLAMEAEISERVKEKLLGKRQDGEGEATPQLPGTPQAPSFMQSQMAAFPLLNNDAAI